MGRSRRLDDLRNDAYKRADCEGATDRHPSADVTRYVNQGGAELYDLLVEARGRAYYRKNPPATVTTTASTSRYVLPTDFYRLISVRKDGPNGFTLEAFQPQDEPMLREPSSYTNYPTYYEIRPGAIELLPFHVAGTSIIVDYVPVYPDLVADGDTFDGINGWEEYVVDFAARCMAVKDEEYDLVRALDGDMVRLRERIMKLAPGRDSFRAERVKDVRGERMYGLGRYGRGW